MVITPLGAGSEVGRSCVHMTFKGRTVLVSTSFIILPHSPCKPYFFSIRHYCS